MFWRLLLCGVFAFALSACTTNQGAEKPRLIRSATPAYPYYAMHNKIEGKVVTEFDVDAEGKVSQMRILQSDPQHLFDDSVISAVSYWRFERNKPYKNMQKNFVFKMSPDNQGLF